MIFTVLLCLNLLFITYQDFKERKVYLINLLITLILISFYHYLNSYSTYSYLYTILLNCVFLSIIFLVLYLYTVLRIKEIFLKTIGLGDIIFFIILAIGFPTLSFLIIFSSSLIFSFILFIFLKPRLTNKTVPLAGLQSLFLVIVVLLNNIFEVLNLYAM